MTWVKPGISLVATSTIKYKKITFKNWCSQYDIELNSLKNTILSPSKGAYISSYVYTNFVILR